ncbi:unnamed protein product (macronuclear) [Paramecium tetraurelia]|uniref:Uncharacterized protein n=1 Tax=Paramecium tetraurelia TaxID=5888 RepID=A0E220_PARTE|nr:uncharacterized protein GSPATT00022508001 [Paramecium tetraurelia]CAK89337.1 unnamed protein product [Paramecium tetraurelia]|eukprot:XP_001456734.1 hypothetical protein (macronuclear) [Paramecium tetraurelia strain d4-2]
MAISKVPGGSTSELYAVHFYQFLVENVVPNEDIFVVLKALHDQSSFPSLYISKVNQYPTIHDELCGNNGMDVCVIEEENLIANTTYYLGVYCMQDCDYELTIHYEEEEVLALGEAVIVKFANETESILKVGMPSSMDGIDRILIRAHYIQDRNTVLKESFHFYVNEGNETPSPVQFQYEAEGIWMIGKGVVIYKNSTNLKGNLTVLILGVPNTRMYFVTTIYERIRSVGLFERIDDLVIETKTNYYKLSVQDEYFEFLDRNSLSFDIHPFEGNPDVYITPCHNGECSLDYKEYLWQSQLDLGYESITISRSNRIKNGNEREFIIAINGVNNFSSFSFVAYLSNYYSRVLSIHTFESGFLGKNELAEYIVDTYDELNQTFTITANYPRGHGIIILKKCSKNKIELSQVTNHFAYIINAGPDNYYNCSITKEQIEQIQIGQVLKSGSSELHSAENTMQFYYNKTECQSNVTMLKYENVLTNCQYVVGVYSNVEYMNYQIFIKGQEKHVELTESTTHRSFLMEYSTDLYSFTIHDDDLVEVVFQITAITGEYDAFASRLYEKPNSTFFDRNANMDLDVLQYKAETETNDLSGEYYIRIIAKALLRYTITPIVYRKSHEEINYIQLTESIPYSHLQTKIDSITYFNFEYRQNGPLFIHLNGIYGYFICYVIGSNGVIDDRNPDSNKYDFALRSSQHTLIIDNPKQYYYIQVNSISLGLNESYEIQYTSSSSLMELFYGEPLITQLDNSHQSFYYYQNPYALEKLFIVRTFLTENNEQNNLKVYISLKNKFPNQENCDYEIPNSATYLTLSNIAENTIVYIGVNSVGYNEYSLLIRGVTGITEIQDNTVQQVPIPSFEQYQSSNLYFLVPKNLNSTIQIQAYTQFAEIILFCAIKDYAVVSKDLRSNNHSIFPNSSTNGLEEEASASVSNKLLVIYKEQLQVCQTYKQGCVLLISVKLDQQSLFSYIQGNSYNNISTVNGEDGYFNIMISTQYSIIKNGEMLIGYAGENMMSYYYFYVDTPVQFIQITARPVDDCDPDLYVNKLINDTISYPTEDSNTYKSMSYKSDILIIRETDNVGSYIIGVSGFRKECTYELLLNFADIEMYYISNGQLATHQINHTVYYFYQHIKKESFRILIQRMNSVDVAINTYSQYNDSDDGLFDLLPYQGTDDIKILQEHNDNLFGGVIQINQTNKHFCYYCTYIIALKPLRSTEIQLLIAYNSIALEIEHGRIYYDQCVETCKYQVEHGDLNIYVYSQNIELYFYENETLKFAMNLSNSQHAIPINASYTVSIVNPNVNSIASYWLSLQSQQKFINLHLGKSYKANNSVAQNVTQFTFTPITVEQEYTIIVNSKSNVGVELFYLSKNVTEFILINPIQEWSVSKSQLELKYILPSVDYYYKITLRCQGQYSITLNLEGLKYIDQNQHYIEQIQSAQIYNIYGARGQELLVEKIDCLGKTESNLTSYQFRNSSDIYFNVTPTSFVSYNKNGISIRRNIYSLIPHLKYSHDAWYYSKAITYQAEENTEDQTLTVTVDTMKRNKTGISQLRMLIYQLHYSNQEPFMNAFGCQMDVESLKHYTSSELFHSKSLQTIKEEDEIVSFQIPLPQDETVLYGLIVFQAFYQEYDAPYTYFYNTSLIYNRTQIKAPIKKDLQANNDYVIMILMAAVTGLVLLLLFLGIRKVIQRRKQSLQFKSEKIKNVTVDEEQEQVKTV